MRFRAPSLLAIVVVAACERIHAGEGPDRASLFVPDAFTTIVAAPTPLVVGGTLQLRASFEAGGEAGDVGWKSTRTAVATVNGQGLVSGVDSGRAVIVASLGRRADSIRVTVLRSSLAPAAVLLQLSPQVVVLGATATLTVVVKDANGAVVPGAVVTFTSSAPTVLSVDTAGTVTGTGLGTATVTGTSGSAVGTLDISVLPPPTSPPPATSPGTVASPAMPQQYLNFAFPRVTGRSIVVAAGGNLQAVLDSARRGDEVVIQAGATFQGRFVLRNKGGTSGGGWVLVRSSQLSAIAPGVRARPSMSSAMPKLVTSSYRPVLATEPGASGWWLSGLELALDAGYTSAHNGLVLLGSGNSRQSSLSAVPTDLVLDRTWVHGSSRGTLKRCIALNSARTSIQDSYLGDCHANNMDSQAIAGWNGPGPYRIVNNTLIGAAENVIFGGADPSIANLTPSDIEFRRNYVYTPGSWKGVWMKKNLLELKHAQRVLVEGNVFDGSWADGQVGFGLVLKSVNASGRCTWCRTTDIVIRRNIMRNAGGGFNLAGDGGGNTNPIGERLSRVLIEGNVLEQLNQGIYTGDAKMVQVLANVQDLIVRSNTMRTASHVTFLTLGAAAATDLAYTDNLVTYGRWGLFGDGQGVGAAALRNVSGAIVWANVAVIAATAMSGYPAGTTFTTSPPAGVAVGADLLGVQQATSGVVIP